jgi:hypothetical protein
MNEQNFKYLILRAMPDAMRFEMLNAGVVVFDAENTSVRIDSSKKRLRVLHPDLGRIDLSLWAQQIQDELRNHPTEMQRAVLSMMCSPFIADKETGETVGTDAITQAEFLFSRFVGNQPPTLPALKRNTAKQTKLVKELRDWFKSSKIFSNKIEDLSKHRVVANYPVTPASDLYSDFALMNGRLHVIETLDLRGIDHLTQAMRGDAAIKGITLNEIEAGSNAIAIITASDYGIAKPAISMISRYADDVYDLSAHEDRRRFADFMSVSLHHNGLELPLQH